MHPTPGFLVEKLDSMLEAGEVIKQSGKEFLSVLPRDSNMFTVCNNIMNQIYCINASLKSVSLINGMAHSVPVSDFNAFDIGDPPPAAPPSPPPIPVPQPGTSQTRPKIRKATAAFGSQQQMEAQEEEQEQEDDDGGDEGAGAKKKMFTKEQRTGIYEPCNKTLYTEYRCCGVDITDPRYNTKRGAPTVFVSQDNECHCGKMCDDQADLAQHVTNDHPPNSVWNCNFCAHNSTKRDYIWKHVRTQHNKSTFTLSI